MQGRKTSGHFGRETISRDGEVTTRMPDVLAPRGKLQIPQSLCSSKQCWPHGARDWNSARLQGDPPHTRLGPQVALYHINLNNSSASPSDWKFREGCPGQVQKGKEN